MERKNFSTRSPFEPLRGYSRAVQVGDTLYVSGTTAMTSSGEVIAPGEPYEQTRYALAKVRKILSVAGFSMQDVVLTRMFVTNINRWEEYARAHREAFENIRPASSIVQVAKLVDARLVLEIEVQARTGVQKVHNLSIEPDEQS